MKKKIKLIIFHPYSYLGGADNSLSRLINNLNLKKFSILFLSLNNSYLKKTLGKKISFKTINVSRSLLSIPKLRNEILNINERKYKKIIIISNQNFANIISYFATLNLKNIKKIFIDRNHLDELQGRQNNWNMQET